MIIDRIALTGFGKYKDKDFRFDKGLNLVIGPNEAGKSTIQAAIFCGFFGTRSDAIFWGEPGFPCQVEIDYRVDGQAYMLTRDLAADKAILLEDGREISRKTQLKKIVADHLGLGDERIFENTVFVRSDELKPLGKDGNIKLIKDRIEELLTGSRHVTVGQAVKTLNTVYVRVAGTKTKEGRGGQIGDVDERLADLETELDAALSEARVTDESRDKVAALDKEIADMKGEATELQPLLAAVAEGRELNKIVVQRREISRRIETYDDSVKALESRQGELDNSRFAAFPGDIDKSLRRLESDLREKRNAGFERQRLIDNTPPRSSINTPALAGAVLLFAAAVIVGVAVSIAVAVILAAAALIVLLLARRSAVPVMPTESGDGSEKAGIEELEKQIADVLAASGAADIDAFERDFESWRESRQAVAVETAALEKSHDGKNIVALRDERRELLAEEGKRESRISDATRLAIIEMDEVRIIASERRFNEINGALPLKREERSKWLGRLEKETGQRDSGEIEDDQVFLQGLQSELRLKADALRMASEALSGVEKELAGEVVPRISVRAAEYYSRFTGESERPLSLGDNLELTFGDTLKNTEKYLSSGTRDQAFMALRLAITEMICGDSEPPLILDDPFILFDERRLKNMRETIVELAAGQQVILFSHNELYRDWPGNLIELRVE